MNKGIRTYQSLLFPEDSRDKSAISKGRDAELVERRNKLLVARYYYYARIREYQYIKLLDTLEHEFFITKRTISDIVQKHDELLATLRDARPSATDFKRDYPFLVW